MNKKVLVVQTMMKRYRAPFFDRLHRVLEEDGIELRVAYGNPPETEGKKQDNNVELRGPWGKKIRNRWLFGERLLLQPVFGEVGQSDLVVVEQANKNLVNYPLLLLSALGRKKVAYWGHGYDRKGAKGTISRGLKTRLIDRADWWFAYTPGTARYLRECGVRKEIITTVYNSIDTKGFRYELDSVTPSELIDARSALGLDERNRIGLYCGALYKDKQIGFLIEAATRIRNALPDFELLVVGGGPDKDALLKDAEGKPWVHCLGPKFGQEKALYFRMAHVFLHPGVVGLGILDCLTAGLPIATTDLPGHGPEIDYLEDGGNGLMIPHDPERYAEEVVRLFKDESRLSRMRENALESGKGYSIEAMVENFKNGIMDCLSLRT